MATVASSSKYSEQPGIRIELRLEGLDLFPANFLFYPMSRLEDIIYESEREELDFLIREWLPLSEGIQVEFQRQLSGYKGQSVLIESAENGSIVIIGVVAGLSYWVVASTLGETFKDAYKDSDMHRRLKQLFLKRLGGRTEALSQRLQQEFTEHDAASSQTEGLPSADGSKFMGEVSHSKTNGHATIEIRILPKDWNYEPPLLSLLLEQWDEERGGDEDISSTGSVKV